MEFFGKRLQKLREKSGLSMKQVAEKIDVPVSTYRDWEYGRAIRGNPYLKLAQVLNVSLYELMTGEKPNYTKVSELLDRAETIIEEIRKELLPLL